MPESSTARAVVGAAAGAAVEGAATGATVPSQHGTGVNTSATAPPKKPVVEQNPAFRMMGA